MEINEKLEILAESAKYDVSCASSGSDRKSRPGEIGNARSCGICHSWSEDGRCISLLKVLYTNVCIYDCAYCINRKSNDIRRAAFTPDELIELVMGFYKRNYIEGLFLSSAVKRSPDETMHELMEIVMKLRLREHFNGYIHLKLIPGASLEMIDEIGKYVDRLSVNIELPTEQSLKLLAPDKSKGGIIPSMSYIRDARAKRQHFISGGQSTQLIVGATPDSDRTIMHLSESLYNKMKLKRVYYSAYVPVNTSHPNLPALVETPMLREHRLYQSDWLLRFYGFKASEILSEYRPNLDLSLDPKAHWALEHMEFFPVDVMKADYYALLRVPGLGPQSAKRIVQSRRTTFLDEAALKRIGVVLKRARYFILSGGKPLADRPLKVLSDPGSLQKKLLLMEPDALGRNSIQLDLFDLYPELKTSADKPLDLLLRKGEPLALSLR